MLYVGSGCKDEDGGLSEGDIDGGCLGRSRWAIKGGMACERAWIYYSNGSVEKGAVVGVRVFAGRFTVRVSR